MLTVKSKEHYNKEILINPDNIQYIVPSIGGEAVVYFSKTDYLVVAEDYDVFKAKFTVSKRQKELSSTSSDDNFESGSIGYKDLDQYPANLPRLPTGYVDRRTTAYKEYIASV